MSFRWNFQSAWALSPSQSQIDSAKLDFARWMRSAAFILMVFLSAAPAIARDRWTAEKANAWYGAQAWPVGSDYIPADAINQMEMWQGDTFDPKRIDLELGWAEGLGMNTMRVFLHDLLWQQDRDGFEKRVDAFLAIAEKHHIRPMLVLFDSCWDPEPKLGPQRAPMQGVHNSGWVQSHSASSRPLCFF